MLFTKPANEITFADVENFCREFGEGVRVEYKREVKHIPKVVSAFANTHGGVFIIGAETDKANKVEFPIPGIPLETGIEERIQQSALTGIYPAEMPEVILVKVPDSEDNGPDSAGNVVVIVRVDESVQAPHAIENSTKAYIRVGSITQPYQLAEMDRLQYMFKRREDSQVVTRQILKRIEERVETLCDTTAPNLTVVARPAFPYRPIIARESLWELKGYLDTSSSPRRVAGGVYGLVSNRSSYSRYVELNEYGVVYLRDKLERETSESPSEKQLYFTHFLNGISRLIGHAKRFYAQGEYMGNIEFTAQLRQVFGTELVRMDSLGDQLGPLKCADSEVATSTQCLSRDFVKRERLIDIVEELAEGLLWAFNTAKPKKIRDKIEWVLKDHRL